MSPDEFRLWYKTHRASFPEIDSWLSRQPNRQEVLESWRATLAQIDFSDACSVSEQMGFGEISAPRVFGDTARQVRRAARELVAQRMHAAQRTRRIVDGLRTVRCRDCEDDGYVLCWHPRSVAYARHHRASGPKFKSYTVLVVCACEAGNERLKQRWAQEVRASGQQPPRYEPRRWCRITKLRYAEQLQELLDWCTETACVESTADNFQWAGAGKDF
jgi:hypothetical protein